MKCQQTKTAVFVKISVQMHSYVSIMSETAYTHVNRVCVSKL